VYRGVAATVALALVRGALVWRRGLAIGEALPSVFVRGDGGCFIHTLFSDAEFAEQLCE
jgi:hypothetical protein